MTSARLRVVALGVWLLLLAWAAAVLVPHLVRGGLQPCAKLDARLCHDLGPADCAIWAEALGRYGAASTTPHRPRRNRTVIVEAALHRLLGWDDRHADNPLCYDELAPDVYPHVLAGIRGNVATHRHVSPP
jgi:hypothetical protein